MTYTVKNRFNFIVKGRMRSGPKIWPAVALAFTLATLISSAGQTGNAVNRSCADHGPGHWRRRNGLVSCAGMPRPHGIETVVVSIMAIQGDHFPTMGWMSARWICHAHA